MTPESISRALRSHIDTNWSALPVSWPNRPFDTTTYPNYIKPRVKLGESFVGEMGTGGIGHRVGAYFIAILMEPNTGESTAASYAGQLEVMFRKQTIGGVITEEPSSTIVGINGDGKYQYNVKIPFRCFIGE